MFGAPARSVAPAPTRILPLRARMRFESRVRKQVPHRDYQLATILGSHLDPHLDLRLSKSLQLRARCQDSLIEVRRQRFVHMPLVESGRVYPLDALPGSGSHV